jgi:hypothetical protein
MRLQKMDDTISFNDGNIKFSSDDDKAWSDWYSPSEFFSRNDGVAGGLGIDAAPNGDVIFLGDYKGNEDNVEHPFHYTQGTQEAIDIIEEAMAEAPGPKAGFLQGQVLKYMLRLWLKADAKEDAEKARWYLNRLIDSLN